MLKKFSYLMIALIGSSALVCCNNSDDDDYETSQSYTSTQVTSFSLKANSNVLVSLDSVFFSIDQANARIFNADSLPYGTDVSKLIVSITTNMSSAVELTMRTEAGKDTVINYLTNSTDSINFANGPVKLHVVSYDGMASRDYLINVNVHQIIPDSLYWDEMALRPLASRFAAPARQKTVSDGDQIFTLTASKSGAYSLAVTDDPASDNWAVSDVAFPFQPDVESLTVNDKGVLFILDAAGQLYRSETEGGEWTAATGADNWTGIIGCYGSTVMGVQAVDGEYFHATYPASDSNPAEIAEGFPVKGFSSPAKMTTKWSAYGQLVILGGEKADGSLSKDIWGFDGKTWALYSGFPKALKGATIFNYKVAKVDSLSWKVTELPVVIAVGGIGADNTFNKSTYISRDMGLSWKLTDEYLQLPGYIQPRYGAQAVVVNSTLTSSRAVGPWRSYPSVELPRWWAVTDLRSRAITPVTEWECPYIYLFGGYDLNGNLYNQIWKGVINRLTFKPLI